MENQQESLLLTTICACQPQFYCRYPATCKPSPPTNVVATFISYEKRLQRTLTWTAPSPDSVPSVSSYTARCSSQAKTSEVTTAGAVESVVIGSGTPESSNGPLEANESYTCEVVANNSAGSSDPSDATAAFLGGDLPKTGNFIAPKSVVPQVSDIYGEPFENGEWKVGVFTGGGGGTAVAGTGTIITSPLEAAQQPPTSIIELITPCEDLATSGGYGAGVRGTFLPSVFSGMKFSQFLQDFKSIEYKYYKKSIPNCSYSSDAAPTFKLTLYPPYAQFVWTPNRAPPLNGAAPEFDQWNQVSITKTSGSTTDFVANGGWWVTGGLNRIGVDQSLGASLEKWEAYLNSEAGANYKSFLDANVYQIAVEVGTGEGALVTYVNDIRISSGDYDWKFTFEA